MHQNTFSKNLQKQRVQLIFSETKFFYVILDFFQQVFNNFKLDNLAKEARRLKLEDRFEEYSLNLKKSEIFLG